MPTLALFPRQAHLLFPTRSKPAPAAAESHRKDSDQRLSWHRAGVEENSGESVQLGGPSFGKHSQNNALTIKA